MARDPLRILMAVRRRAVEQARLALGVCLAAEARTADKISMLDELGRRDSQAAGAWQEAHLFTEMSAARREAWSMERRALGAELVAMAAGSEQARGAVSDARAASEAVGQLVAERDAAIQADDSRREQHGLDDIGRARMALRRCK